MTSFLTTIQLGKKKVNSPLELIEVLPKSHTLISFDNTVSSKELWINIVLILDQLPLFTRMKTW